MASVTVSAEGPEMRTLGRGRLAESRTSWAASQENRGGRIGRSWPLGRSPSSAQIGAGSSAVTAIQTCLSRAPFIVSEDTRLLLSNSCLWRKECAQEVQRDFKERGHDILPGERGAASQLPR